MKNSVLFLALWVAFMSCETSTEVDSPSGSNLSVEYEKFELENGLDVVFHIDRSDPVVAVALTAHVGSSREKPGRTGFAHLFEHLLFLESENLGKGGLDKLSARVGGSGANGSTSRDRTNYFQTVPKDALEKMIWAEADKLGWFINTVTEPVLAKEKQVVKNEKRQSYDNRPYGQTNYVISKSLYPEDHPYNWQVIGSLEDLQNATLEDVKEFFRRWYVPNNVTLVVSGDFDVEQAKAWVKKYFDEIPAGDVIEPLTKQPASIVETRMLFHEDNFARLPELTLAWPGVELYQEDAYALDVLTNYLASGKSAPMNKVVVDEQKLAGGVRMYSSNSELAGEIQLAVRAFANTDLDSVRAAIESAFQLFEKEGISEEDLTRIKASQETNFYRGLSSVLGKGFQLAQYNIFANDPGFVEKDIQNILNVTTADVKRVYEKYIKNKNYIATSFVPKGSIELALEGSEKASVVEEQIVQGAEESFDPSITAEYEKTPSSFDRTMEPPYGEAPVITVPEVWESVAKNDLKIYGIQNEEVPLIEFQISMDGGLLMDDPNKVGVAYLTAALMNRGTQNKTPEEWENAIKQLGASLRISAGTESIVLSGLTLKRNFGALVQLVEEMLLEPRWDSTEFELLKENTINSIRLQEGNPNALAEREFSKLIYGEENMRSKNLLGTESSVNAITLDDLKNFYSRNLAPNISQMYVVGAITKDDLLGAMGSIESKWSQKEVVVPKTPEVASPDKSMVYFYDVPGAKQSVLRIGYPALKATDPDFYPATVMNYILGGGGFASRLTQQLRETKGYTYGIRSRFSGSKATGPFVISSGVRTNVTLEALQDVKSILKEYPNTFTEADLETTKGFLIKSNARAFETSGAKLNMLDNIASYGLKYDYVKDREEIVKSMTIDQISDLAQKYANPDKMFWLVIGDAETQFDRLKELGIEDVKLINPKVSEGTDF